MRYGSMAQMLRPVGSTPNSKGFVVRLGSGWGAAHLPASRGGVCGWVMGWGCAPLGKTGYNQTAKLPHALSTYPLVASSHTCLVSQQVDPPPQGSIHACLVILEGHPCRVTFKAASHLLHP